MSAACRTPEDEPTTVEGESIEQPEKEYFVQRILAVRDCLIEETGEKKKQYRVRWHGYDRTEDTWEFETEEISKKVAKFHSLSPEALHKLQYKENYGDDSRPHCGKSDYTVVAADYDEAENGIRFTVIDNTEMDGDEVDDITPREMFAENSFEACRFLASKLLVDGLPITDFEHRRFEPLSTLGRKKHEELYIKMLDLKKGEKLEKKEKRSSKRRHSIVDETSSTETKNKNGEEASVVNGRRSRRSLTTCTPLSAEVDRI